MLEGLAGLLTEESNTVTHDSSTLTHDSSRGLKGILFIWRLSPGGQGAVQEHIKNSADLKNSADRVKTVYRHKDILYLLHL